MKKTEKNKKKAAAKPRQNKAGGGSAKAQSQSKSKKTAAKGNKKNLSDEEPRQRPSNQGEEGYAENNKTTDNKALEIDETIRNDIFSTEVKPNVQRRTPIEKQEESVDRKDLNIDQRIVNDPDGDIDEEKYLL